MSPKKRGYTREFTARSGRRARIDVDRIPPTLYDRIVARARRQGVSLRGLTLRLLTQWLESPEETP